MKNFYSDKYRNKNISFVDFLKNNRNEIYYKSDVSMIIPNYPNKNIKKNYKKEKKDNGCIIF